MIIIIKLELWANSQGAGGPGKLWRLCGQILYMEDTPSKAELPYQGHIWYPSQSTEPTKSLWYSSVETCHLCNSQNMLFGCKAALTQGWYGWRHNRLLRKPDEILEANRANLVTSKQLISFVRQGGKAQSSSETMSHGGKWNTRADLDHQVKFR